MFKFTSIIRLSGFVLLLFFLDSCRKDVEDTTQTQFKTAHDYSSEVPLAWNNLFLEIDRYSTGYRPPAAARMLGYIGLAAYESLVEGMPQNKSLTARFAGMSMPEIQQEKEYHWPTVVNAVYASMFRYYYPHIRQSDIAKIATLENKFIAEAAKTVSNDVIVRSQLHGAAIAAEVYDFSKSDFAGHDAFKNPRPSAYDPPKTGISGEKLWQPTFPDYTKALFPYWGSVRPFAITESDKLAKPPLKWSENPSSPFYIQAKEVEIWVEQATYEDLWIAEFWSDDIFELTFEPAARQVAIANQLVKEENISLAKTVEFYAKLGMALCDAGIAVWYSKYTYNVERPVTYIRRLMNPNWKTNLHNPINNTQGMSPEFPAYPSGHSGFGAAGSAIMAETFGNSREFVDRSHAGRTEFKSNPRIYNSLLEVGIENAYSRMPLGVHYRMDCDEGIRLGYLAARRVHEMPWKK